MLCLFLLIGYLLGFILAMKIFEFKIEDLKDENLSLKLLLIDNKLDNFIDEDDF